VCNLDRNWSSARHRATLNRDRLIPWKLLELIGFSLGEELRKSLQLISSHRSRDFSHFSLALSLLARAKSSVPFVVKSTATVRCDLNIFRLRVVKLINDHDRCQRGHAWCAREMHNKLELHN
jgi:hypothetical protein